MSKLQYNIIAVITVIAGIVSMVLVWSAYRPMKAAKVTIGVQADDFKASTKAAMDLLNGFVGCEFLVPGSVVRVLSTDGEPCGKAFHPDVDQGHSAGTYQCGDTFEVHVERPGNTHTQVCIIAHEIGHVTGLGDLSRGAVGIMNQYDCPTPIRVSDAEVSYLRAKYCE